MNWCTCDAMSVALTVGGVGAVLLQLLMEAQDHRPGCLPQLAGVPGLEGMDAGVVGSVFVLAVALWMVSARVELAKQALHRDARDCIATEFMMSPEFDILPAHMMRDSDQVAASLTGFRYRPQQYVVRPSAPSLLASILELFC
jgi:hypothetical protein